MKQLLPSLWSRGALAGADKGDPFRALHREIDRMFEDFGGAWRVPALAGREPLLAPAIDVAETDDAIEVSAELPGIDEKDISVEVAEGVLTIKGEKKVEKEEKKKDYHLVERSYGSFQRAITLPVDVDTDKIAAKFAKGVLTVTVPKPAKAKRKSKSISVKGA